MTNLANTGIRNLLVAFNGNEASLSALRYAAELASRSRAHLTGLLAHGSSTATRAIPTWFPDTLRGSIIATVSARAADIRTRFERLAQDFVPEERCHWLEVGGDPDTTVSDYSRMYDLTVLGQFGNHDSAEELALHPARICKESGRPVVIVPRQVRADPAFRHVLIAWDGMRAGTGAVADALPVLRVAGRVSALTVEARHTGHPLAGIDLKEMLRRHGVDCDHRHVAPGARSVSGALLSQADDLGADLIVMGVSAHGPVGRMIAGSVTTDIMERTAVPLFLSQ